MIFRDLIKAAIVAVIALAVSTPVGAALLLGGSQPPGFFPVGHWLASPTGLGLTLVFPQPDSVTSATARIHQAYWDGTNDIPYDAALGVEFGAYPYVFTLISGPPGMRIEQPTYTTFQNVQYGRLLWHPQGNISSAWSGQVEVLVTDQQLNTITISYGLWTVGAYTTTSLSSATATTTATSTTVSLSVTTGSVVPGMVLTGSNIPSGDYVITQLTGTTGGTGTYQLAVAASTSVGPDSVTGSAGQGAVFISASGSGTSCTYGSPCSATQAFGSTFASTSYPGAIAYAFAGTYSSNSAQFTGIINNGSGGAGTNLTIASGLTGAVAIGENCAGPGSSAANGTTIVSGSGTNWQVSVSQNLASSTIVCSTVLPAYTDTDTGVHGFEPYTARKPGALIGLAGQTITYDGTENNTAGYSHFIQVGGHAADWYMENIGENGYNESLTNAVIQQILLGTSARQTYDQDTWTNSGYGTGASGNMSWFVSSGQQTPRQYLFITDSTESNRESGLPGNNMGFLDLYAYQYALIQRDTENSPGNQLNAAFYLKIDELYSTLREDYVNADAVFAFAGFGAQNAGNGKNDNDYNLIITPQVQVGGSPNFTWQGFAFYRNTVVAGSGNGLTNAQTSYNLEGPGDDGLIGVTGTTGGSLIPTDTYTWGMTCLGNSGESAMVIGSYGSASGSNGGTAGSTNEKTYALPSGDTAANITWLQEPGATGYNIYRGQNAAVSSASCSGTTVTIGTASPHGLSTGAVVNQSGFSPTEYNGTTSIAVTGGSSYTYTVSSCPGTETALGTYAAMQLATNIPSGSTTTYTDDGNSTTATYPPTTSTAIANGQFFYYYDNAFATTNATSPPPSGAVIAAPAYPTALFNIADSGGASALICLNTTTMGCNAAGQRIGDLNTTYSGTYGTYNGLNGTVGYKIQ